MVAFFSVLARFFTPVIAIATALVSVVGLILWSVANPESAVNLFVCKIIDLITSAWPSTPAPLRISALVDASLAAAPGIGRGIISDIFGSIFTLAGFAITVKIYKLLPFKAT